MKLINCTYPFLLLALMACSSKKKNNIDIKFTHADTISITAGASKQFLVKATNFTDTGISIENYIVSCGCTKVTFSNSADKTTHIPGNSNIDIIFDITTSSSEKNKEKEILCSFKTNGSPQIKQVAFQVRII